MKLLVKFALVTCLVLSGIQATIVFAEDQEPTAEKKVAASGAELAKTCTACHGSNGISISPEFPNLAGQYRSYLAYALRGYRSGERQNAVMQSFATNLSDEEINNLAEYYSAQSGLGPLPK
ncbi:MAG: cytochrome c [Gammaproteobacteria bacterium]|nr:cytochrome c [Gammaproteobacteria bacterium]